MNKTKIVLAAVGGVTLVAVLAAAGFVWCEYAAKDAALVGDDESVGLETVTEQTERLSRKTPYPCAESVKVLTASSDAVKAWKDEAYKYVSRGDRPIKETTDAAFKEFLIQDAKRLQGLPAGSEKKTLAETFDFGLFKPYISEGQMPEQKTLKELQRKWDDFAMLVEMLSANGVDSITAFEVKAATAAKPDEEQKPAKNKKAKKPAKKGKVEAPSLQPAVYTYVVTCKTHPAAFVRVIDALASDERFVIVNDFALGREKDDVLAGLGGEKKEEAAAPTPSRRRRRGGAVAAEKAKEETEKSEAEQPKLMVLTDPEKGAPFEAKLTVSIYDFRSCEVTDEAKDGEEAK